MHTSVCSLLFRTQLCFPCVSVPNIRVFINIEAQKALKTSGMLYVSFSFYIHSLKILCNMFLTYSPPNSSTIHTLFLCKLNLAPHPLHTFVSPLTPICTTRILLYERSPTEASSTGQEPHLKGNWLPLALQLAVTKSSSTKSWLYATSSLHPGISSDLSSHRSRACCHNCCEITCTTVLLHPENSVRIVTHCLCLLHALCPLFLDDP